MKIHLTGAFEYMDVNVGFGNAADQIYQTFKSYGLDMSVSRVDDRTPHYADIEICFDQPQRYKFVCPDAYRIGYTPWESTELMAGWRGRIDHCNEIWTPNKFGREVFQYHFPDKPVFVYQHGISQRYRPKKRKLRDDKPFTFLFIGEPQWRKDAQMAVEVFIELFGNNPDYRFILKATKISNVSVKDPKGQMVGPPDVFYDNVITMRKIISPANLIDLYNEADVFIYPSWGEGWGFNPMQAISLGIPTISTYAWSDYAKYITVPIDSFQQLSPWPEIHPGLMYKPDRSQLKQAMKIAKENYNLLADQAFRDSFKMHEDFNWEKVSIPAIQRLENIFSTLEVKV